MPVKKAKKSKDLAIIFQKGSNLSDRLINSLDELEVVVNDLKEKQFKIVLTQGVYDLIHEGHARYLEMAKSYGDILIVGVDSDELTRKRKGKNRPVVPEDERLEMLVHLRHVDIVVKREIHHDIGDLIRVVKPDVLISSLSTKDFTKEMAKEYSTVCKKIIVLPPQAVSSTSARIRRLTIEGAENLAEEINKLTKDFINKIRST